MSENKDKRDEYIEHAEEDFALAGILSKVVAVQGILVGKGITTIEEITEAEEQALERIMTSYHQMIDEEIEREQIDKAIDETFKGEEQ